MIVGIRRSNRDPSARLLPAVILYPVDFAGANPASPVLSVGLARASGSCRATRSATFVPFRPGSLRRTETYSTPRRRRQPECVSGSSGIALRRVRVATMGSPPVTTSDALLDLLMPLWQLVIGLLVLVTLVVSTHRLFMRGPSRMGGAMLLVGGAVVCVAVLSYLFQTF